MTYSFENYGRELREERKKNRRQKCLDEAVREVLRCEPYYTKRMIDEVPPANLVQNYIVGCINLAFKRLMEERG